MRFRIQVEITGPAQNTGRDYRSSPHFGRISGIRCFLGQYSVASDLYSGLSACTLEAAPVISGPNLYSRHGRESDLYSGLSACTLEAGPVISGPGLYSRALDLYSAPVLWVGVFVGPPEITGPKREITGPKSLQVP